MNELLKGYGVITDKILLPLLVVPRCGLLHTADNIVVQKGFRPGAFQVSLTIGHIYGDCLSCCAHLLRIGFEIVNAGKR
jgi:hypothetical protein